MTLLEQFPGRWDWCDHCGYAVVICLECCNSSCNGGGCDKCRDDWAVLSAADQCDYPKREEIPDTTELRGKADYRSFMLRRWCKGVEGVEHNYVQWIDPDRGPSDSLLQCLECRSFDSVKGEGWYVLTTYEDWVRHCQNWKDLEKL